MPISAISAASRSRRAWLGLVLPALLLNYFGQGALVLADPAAIENPFYRLVPETLLLPMVVLATAATVIASQAVITGAYSLVQQAIQLGLLPRLAILHTSAAHSGQIYMPRVNTALLVGVLLLVGLFRTSSALASAYGIAVATTMVVDGVLGFIVIWKLWKWPAVAGGAADRAAGDRGRHVLLGQSAQAVRRRLGAAAVRRLDGAADPDLAARHAHSRAKDAQAPRCRSKRCSRSLEKKPPHIVPGTAVFLTSDPEFAPTALLHNLKHNKVLHEHNVILTIVTADTPRVPRRGAGDDHADVAALHRVALQVRLHGDAERAEGAGDRAQAGLALRHHVDVVLPVAALAQAVGAFRHAALAGPAVHRAGQDRRAMRPTSSRSRPGGWWRSARRSRSELDDCA